MRRKLLSLCLLLLLCAATAYILYTHVHPAEPAERAFAQGAPSPTPDLDKQLLTLSNQVPKIKVVEPAARLSGHADGISAVAFSPDNKLIATGSGDCTVKLWRRSDLSLLRSFEAHQHFIDSLAFSPDSNTLISADSDGAILVWNIPRLELIDRRIQPGRHPAVAFLPDGQHFVTLSYNNLLRWSLSSSESTAISIMGDLTCIAISPTGEVAVGAYYGSVARCNPLSGQVLARHERRKSMIEPIPDEPSGNHNSIYCVRYLQNGDILIDDHDALWRWNPTSNDIQPVFRISIAQAAPFDNDMLFAIHDYTHFGFISSDNLWETVYAELDEIHSIAASPDGALIAVANGGMWRAGVWTPGGPHDLLLFDTSRILHYRELNRQIEEIQRARAAARHTTLSPKTQIVHFKQSSFSHQLTPWQ